MFLVNVKVKKRHFPLALETNDQSQQSGAAGQSERRRRGRGGLKETGSKTKCLRQRLKRGAAAMERKLCFLNIRAWKHLLKLHWLKLSNCIWAENVSSSYMILLYVRREVVVSNERGRRVNKLITSQDLSDSDQFTFYFIIHSFTGFLHNLRP